MYTPAHFRSDDVAQLHKLMTDNSFATLVTVAEGVPFATHLPVLLDSHRGADGTLRAHVARANPQWQHFANGEEVLVIFQGPHAYISPSSYVDHPAVPTWNYAVVHAYGRPVIVDDDGLRSIIEATVEQYEDTRSEPWRMESLSEEFVAKMMRAIVGFEIEITRLEGKFKMSQNRKRDDQLGTIAALKELPDPISGHVADWMAANLGPSDLP